MKHLLKMSDLTPDEVAHILDVADELKAQQKAGGTEPLLKGKSVALMFSKNSTRTRTSFEVGVYQLGGLGNYMNAATELQSSRGEPLKDTARVLGRYYDCVVWRTYRQSDLEEFAEFAGVPVINGLTDYAHPCQVLADLMTIRERRGALAGQKLCFVGDGSNMANSLIVGGLLSGMKVDCVCPHGYRPAADVLMFAHKYGSAFRLLEDPAEGVKDADVVVTAVWNTARPGTQDSEQRLREIFADIGILGMTGSREIAAAVRYLRSRRRHTRQEYQLSDVYQHIGYELYGSECDAARQKGIEQKIRRAIQKAQSHLAARGSEDFYDEIFTEYASRLFDFGQVQQEMRMLQGKGSQSGKINTKKFFEGILLKLED